MKIIVVILLLILSSITNASETGIASWYIERNTASGEKYNRSKFTAAHRKLPFGAWVKVTRLDNQKYIFVRINDRGPFKKKRIIDLSYVAAKELGILNKGVLKVKIEVCK